MTGPFGAADATVVVDPRFLGGTAQALIGDVEALLASGMTVGLVLFESGRFFRPEDKPNPEILALDGRAGVLRDPVRTAILMLHNPQPFGRAQIAAAPSPPSLPDAERTFMVAHHPPFLGDGALAYDPLTTAATVARLTGQSVGQIEWLPVSGLVRKQLDSFRPLIHVHCEDWPNGFDVGAWTPAGPKLEGPVIAVGRHGRAHPDKWPATAAEVAASLPAGPGVKVRTLGADPAFLTHMGVDCAAWDMRPFGSQAPQAFLRDLDVFSYFHAPRWREAFGRTVAEAMLCGVPCVLDANLRPTFADHALYPAPAEVPDLLARMRTDPAPHLARARAASEWCRSTFDARDTAARLRRVMASQAPGLADRSVRPLTALRKWIGFHRRQWDGAI